MPSDPRYVLPTGPPDSPIVILGDHPGPEEMRQRKPFVGWSGRKLDEMLGKAGVLRSQCLIGNVWSMDPAKFKGGNLEKEQAACREWVEAYPRQMVIVLGNTAMECLINRKGILDYRGSLIPKEITDLPYDIFCMVNPAFISRDWSFDTISRADIWIIQGMMMKL
jgi:uracil-DNA glycosylase family 4